MPEPDDAIIFDSSFHKCCAAINARKVFFLIEILYD